MAAVPTMPHPPMATPAPPAANVPPGGGMPPAGPEQKAPPKQVIETSHGDMIHDAQLDYYGRRLATCSSDRTIKIFQVDRNGTNRLEATLEGHDGPVWQVCWSHPTRHGRPMIASASYDGRVLIWMEEQIGIWRQYFDYSWHASSVNSVAFAPHEYGLAFACASSDGFVSVCSQLSDGTWDERRVSEAHDGGAHTHPLGALSVSWMPAVAAGALWMPERAQPPPMTLATAGCDNLVKIWAFDEASSNWKLQGKPLKMHREMVRSVAWAPNLGLPRSIIASGGQDRKVIVWTKDLDNEHSDGSDWVPTELPVFTGPVWSVSWNPTGSMLGVTSGDDGVSLWKEEIDGTWRNLKDISGTASASEASN